MQEASKNKAPATRGSLVLQSFQEIAVDLRRALQRSIRGQMPLRAVSGSISGELELRSVYTRAGSCTPDSDMVLLITGMAPVIYLDPEGKLA